LGETIGGDEAPNDGPVDGGAALPVPTAGIYRHNRRRAVIR
jgi:hypothetical protein